MNTKICTSIKQSKKLLELGIDMNTADMHYYKNSFGDYIEGLYNSSDLKEGCELKGIEYIPAWSLNALMNLLPSEFTTENEFGKYIYEIKIRKYKLIENVNLHQIAYGNYKFHEDGSSSWKDMINTGEKEELLDAAYEMVVWLKENNKI